MDLGLRNKRVLVTGASRGIGAAIAKGFLTEGVRSCIVSRGSNQLYQTEQELISEFGKEKVFAEKCDCTDPGSLTTLSIK